MSLSAGILAPYFALSVSPKGTLLSLLGNLEMSCLCTAVCSRASKAPALSPLYLEQM